MSLGHEQRTNKWMVFEASMSAALRSWSFAAYLPSRQWGYEMCARFSKFLFSLDESSLFRNLDLQKDVSCKAFLVNNWKCSFFYEGKKMSEPILWTGRALRTFIFEIQMMQKKKFYLFKKKENSVIKPLYQSLNVRLPKGQLALFQD